MKGAGLATTAFGPPLRAMAVAATIIGVCLFIWAFQRPLGWMAGAVIEGVETIVNGAFDADIDFSEIDPDWWPSIDDFKPEPTDPELAA